MTNHFKWIEGKFDSTFRFWAIWFVVWFFSTFSLRVLVSLRLQRHVDCNLHPTSILYDFRLRVLKKNWYPESIRMGIIIECDLVCHVVTLFLILTSQIAFKVIFVQYHLSSFKNQILSHRLEIQSRSSNQIITLKNVPIHALKP